MAKAYANRAWMTTATTGTGTITLGTAKAGYLTFAEAGVANTNTVTYVITDGNDFEIGTGTYTTSGTTMSRDTVIASKIGGTAGTSKINLSGTAEVFLTISMADVGLLDRVQSWTAAQQFSTIELGHATDTTLARSAAGVMTIEGVEVVTLSRTQTLSGKTITDLILDGALDEEEFTITDGAAFVIDPSNGSLQKITLGANRTPAAAPGGWTAGKGLLLKINDGSAYSITWSTLGVTWVGGSPPTLATTGWTVVALWRDADAIYGKHIGDVA
jgi:hypothetical protein